MYHLTDNLGMWGDRAIHDCLLDMTLEVLFSLPSYREDIFEEPSVLLSTLPSHLSLTWGQRTQGMEEVGSHLVYRGAGSQIE